MNFNRILAFVTLVSSPFCGYLFVRDLWVENPMLTIYALALSVTFWINQLGVAIGGTWNLVDAE